MKTQSENNLVRKINNLNHVIATLRDRKSCWPFPVFCSNRFNYKIKFQFCSKDHPVSVLLLFFHRFRVNKLYHLWLRDWLCRPIKNPQDSASNYWYFSVLCVQIYGFICLITAGAFSLFCVLVPFRSWLFRRVCFRGFLLTGFLFARCVFTDIQWVDTGNPK